MSLRGYVRQLKPRTENYIPPVDKVQSYLTEGMLDLKIVNNTLRGSSTLRGEVLVQAVKDGTPIETNKGVVKLSWMNDEDRISAEGGNYETAYILAKIYAVS